MSIKLQTENTKSAPLNMRDVESRIKLSRLSRIRAGQDDRYPRLRTALGGTQFDIDQDGIFVADGENSTPVCSPFELLGLTRMKDGMGWGVALAVCDPDGNVKDVIFSQHDLQSEPRSVKAKLAAAGLRIRNNEEFWKLLIGLEPPERILLVPQPGWHEDLFVAPDGTAIGAVGEEDVRLEKPLAGQVVGSLEGQTAGLRAAFGSGAAHFGLAVLAGVAGCICDRVGHGSSPILALVGESSKGKTTALKIAASAFGNPKIGDGPVSTLRSTTNAVEVLAARANGTFLGLDEGANTSNDEMQTLVFTLAGGRAKGRQTRGGSLRDTPGWCTFVMLSSEQGIAEKIGAGRGPMMNGAAVRCLEVDVSGEPYVPDSAMDQIKALDSNFGHVGPRVAKLLAEETPKAIRNRIEAHIARLVGDGAHQLEKRSASVLGLLWEAGELLKRVEVLDGSSDVGALVQRCWEAYRSSAEADRLSPNEKAVNTLREAMFSEKNRTVIDVEETGRIVHAPVAWYKEEGDGSFVFYVPKDNLVRLAGGGVRETALKKELASQGFLIKSAKNMVHDLVPGKGKIRHYRLDFDRKRN